MVLGLDCFGLMAKKVSKSSRQKEAGDTMKEKDAAEEASPKADEKNGDKAVERKSKKEDTRAPLVVPHFPQRSTPGLL
ncbi:hypothetical protein HU200_019835 [Digitaria exilis]|uniref:Uncharacterized protein n=1 Tax=Digitaria exilis TaxID=1010633 RepID=A0A835F2K1_9POAL|nr:hypothetical protein HU200_019835 [Digitaria exilis]